MNALRFRLGVFTFGLVFISAATWPCRAADEEKPKKAYLLFPIRTELQKQVLFDEGEKYHLIVHGDGLLDDKGHIDAAGLNFDDLTNDLGPGRLVFKGDKIDARVILEGNPSESTRRFLLMAVMGWAREMDFERHVPTSVGGRRVWENIVKVVGDQRGLIDEDESEDAVGDDVVKVYPVRTLLSRLQGGDNDDCVVVFQKVFDKDATGTLDDKTKTKVKELVESLKIKDLDQVGFGVRMTRDANRIAVADFQNAVVKELPPILGVKSFSFARRYE